MQMALRRLRKFARQGAAEELDIDGTIRETAKQGILDVQLVPERRNRIKVLMLFDVGGSMDAHIAQCEKLFSAAKTEFKTLEYFSSITVSMTMSGKTISVVPVHASIPGIYSIPMAVITA